MIAPTLSRLGHIAACPGSAAFPEQEEARGPEARLGSAIHAVNERRTFLGRVTLDNETEDLAARFGLDADDAGRLAFLARHMRLPVPAGALSEVSLGYFPDGSVRRFTPDEMAQAHGAGLRYPKGDYILAGTIDLLWSEPSPLFEYSMSSSFDIGGFDCPEGSTCWLTDLKTGDPENVPPPHKNWQLRAGAVLAARWTGARRVVVALCFISPASISAALRAAREAREKAEAELYEATEARYLGDNAKAGLHEDRAVAHHIDAEAHEREAREGRWEIGETLDGAALDAIEVEMRAVLARARGEQGDGQAVAVRGDARGTNGRHLLRRVRADEVHLHAGRWARGGPRGARIPRDRQRAPERGSGRVGALILGAHCTHCHAAPVCPRLNARSLTLARLMARPDLAKAITLDAGLVAEAFAMVPSLERAIRDIKASAQAHARANGGALRLPDGREYGPAVEERRTYDTARTFNVLVPVVGEERANRAAKYTWSAIERALKDAGAPPSAYAQVRKDLEAAGAVVVTSHEEWGYRQPAKPVEVDDGKQRAAALVEPDAGHGLVDVGQTPAGPDEVRAGRGEGAGVALAAMRDGDRAGEIEAQEGGEGRGGPVGVFRDVAGGETPLPPRGPARPVAARATCPTCKREVRVNGDGSLRAHKPCSRRWLTDGATPPKHRVSCTCEVCCVARINGPLVEPARAEPPAVEAPRQLAIVGA